jgi:hypothetical protein
VLVELDSDNGTDEDSDEDSNDDEAKGTNG